MFLLVRNCNPRGSTCNVSQCCSCKCTWHWKPMYCIRKNFCGKNISCVKFSLRLIFVGQITWQFFVALITHRRQIFMCLIFVGQNLYPTKTSTFTVFGFPLLCTILHFILPDFLCSLNWFSLFFQCRNYPCAAVNGRTVVCGNQDWAHSWFHPGVPDLRNRWDGRKPGKSRAIEKVYGNSYQPTFMRKFVCPT